MICIYHSEHWRDLTSRGWITHTVEDLTDPMSGMTVRVAFMVRDGRERYL